MRNDQTGVRRALFGFLIAFVAINVALTAPAAATTPGVDFSAKHGDSLNAYGHSTGETIAAHDLGAMDSPLEVYDDEGNVHELDATYNKSQDAPFGVRWDKVEADAYGLFPRVDGESNNDYTWRDAGNWTTEGANASKVSVTDADADGVQKVQVATDGTMGAGDVAVANYSNGVDITSDPAKRVLMLVLNVNTLDSGANVEVEAVDGDGDRYFTTLNTSVSANASDTITNKTATGVVFQEKLANLNFDGSAGDGTFDSIQHVKFRIEDGDADVTIAGLDADKKSTIDFAKIERDTDGDGTEETVTFEDYYEGGESRLTEYWFGSEFSSAVVHDWTVYDVWYPISMETDESEYSVTFGDSESSYPSEVEMYADIEVPAFIDLSHGTLSVRVEQGSITDRFGVLETASAVSDDTPIGNLSDSDYTSQTGSLGSTGDTVTLLSGISADTEYRVHTVLYLQDGEVDALQSTAVSGGPTGGSGGILGGAWAWIIGIGGSILTAVGLGRVVGSGGG